jgi:hypothetical protein
MKRSILVLVALALVAGGISSCAYFLKLVKTGTPEAAGKALRDWACINARDEDGSTALMYAARNNTNPEVLSVLLKAGADGKARDSSGKTAYDCAQDNKRLKGTDAYRKLNDTKF